MPDRDRPRADLAEVLRRRALTEDAPQRMCRDLEELIARTPAAS